MTPFSDDTIFFLIFAFISFPALTVEFQFSELNVSEAMGTIEVTVIANGTSEVNYTVNLTIIDITTGEITTVTLYM